MTDRDRLIELFFDFQRKYNSLVADKDGLADHLIANGVTVVDANNATTTWRPASEPPTESGKYLVCTRKCNVYQTKFYSYPESKGGHWGQKDKGRSITHWMPLPQPPKEVERWHISSVKKQKNLSRILAKVLLKMGNMLWIL